MITTRPSRRELLARLHAEAADELTVLRRLAAWHSDASSPELDFRDHGVRAGPRVFPAPDMVPALLAVSIGVLRDAFAEAETRSDELLVATFGAYLVTAVHPFPDRNGHVALDFFQSLLQRRWGAEGLSFNDRRDTHELLGLCFAPMDGAPAGEGPEDPLARVDALMRRLDRASLAALWTDPHLVAAAHFLAGGCGVDFQSRLPAHGA